MHECKYVYELMRRYACMLVCMCVHVRVHACVYCVACMSEWVCKCVCMYGCLTMYTCNLYFLFSAIHYCLFSPTYFTPSFHCSSHTYTLDNYIRVYTTHMYDREVVRKKRQSSL